MSFGEWFPTFRKYILSSRVQRSLACNSHAHVHMFKVRLLVFRFAASASKLEVVSPIYRWRFILVINGVLYVLILFNRLVLIFRMLTNCFFVGIGCYMCTEILSLIAFMLHILYLLRRMLQFFLTMPFSPNCFPNKLYSVNIIITFTTTNIFR